MNPSLAIDWRPRPEPLEPCALVARGEIARALARRVLALSADRLRDLKGGEGKDWLVIAGLAERLPWVPGVLYFGAEAGAPNVLFPTALEPGIPAALLDRALARRFPRAPMLVIPDPPTIIPLDTIRPLERKRIEEWLNHLTGGNGVNGESPEMHTPSSPFPPVQEID